MPGNPWARMHLAHFRSCASTRACWAALSAWDRREQVLAGAHRRIGLRPRVLPSPVRGKPPWGRGSGQSGTPCERMQWAKATSSW